MTNYNKEHFEKTGKLTQGEINHLKSKVAGKMSTRSERENLLDKTWKKSGAKEMSKTSKTKWLGMMKSAEWKRNQE